jgi:hypothetical protein
MRIWRHQERGPVKALFESMFYATDIQFMLNDLLCIKDI